MSKLLFALLAGSLALPFSAHADDLIQELPEESATEAATETTVDVVLAPSVAQKVQKAAEEAVQLLAARRAGEDAYVALNLVVGVPVGIRAQVFVYRDARMSLAVEGMVGGMPLTAVYGGGLRAQFRVAASSRNSFNISPGASFMVSPPDPSFFGHPNTHYYFLADADLSWVHDFARHFGIEVGIKLGGQFATEGRGSSRYFGSRVLPVVGVFTGVRF